MTNTQKKQLGKGHHPNSHANLVIGREKLAEKRRNGTLAKPVGYSLTSALKHSLGKMIEKPDLDAPARDHVVYQTIQGALKREPTSQNIVWDRSDGKVLDKHAILGDITIRIVEDATE